MPPFSQSLTTLLSEPTIKIALGTLLGLFIGLEREWSNKPAGIRTFALTAILGVVFSLIGLSWLIVSGVLFVITFAVLLGYSGVKGVQTDTEIDSLEDETYGLALTTSVSLLVTYSLGILLGYGFISEAVIIAILSSALLALKKELHSFAWGLTKEEVRSAIEFAIIAFVVYPILPSDPIDPWGVVNLQLVWTLVIATSGIGFVNYLLAQKYQGNSFLITGFLGGFVNSTAVIISITQRASKQNLQSTLVGSMLLANAAMAVRNAIIVLAFHPTALLAIAPLLTISIVGILATFIITGDNETIENDLNSPFSLKNALVFGGLFLLVLVISGFAEQVFGGTSFLATAFLSGLVSSGTATTAAISLYATNTITFSIFTGGVLIGTLASIIVKIVFVLKFDVDQLRPIILYNGLLIVSGIIVTVILFPL